MAAAAGGLDVTTEEGKRGLVEKGTAVLDAGTRLGEYEIERLLGVGSMGAVYEAVCTATSQRFAIKVLSPALAAMPTARARFLNEAKLTARVRHPHIVDVSDVGEDAGRSYFVMELLERRGSLAPAPAVRTALRRRDRGHHRAGVRRGGGGASARRHASRPQAVEHLPPDSRAAAASGRARLRHRQGRGRGAARHAPALRHLSGERCSGRRTTSPPSRSPITRRQVPPAISTPWA